MKRATPTVRTSARRAAVLGSPIAHSLSPALHRAAYDALGLDWSYDAIECDTEGLPAFVDACDDTWVGLSLTMPLKYAVIPLLDEMSELVSTTGVANTVVLRDGERIGDNTDVHGIVAALRDAGVDRVRSVTVLGAGATAVSAMAAARELGARDAMVIARSAERATTALEVADRIGLFAEHDPWPGDERSWSAELLVSTVPAGAPDGLLPPRAWPKTLLDVVYDPWPTALAQAAASEGVTVVGGLAMLVHQAARQVELMTGHPAPLDAMWAAVAR